jgi:hypothetical protein
MTEFAIKGCSDMLPEALIYPSSIEKHFTWKKPKNIYNPLYLAIPGRLRT